MNIQVLQARKGLQRRKGSNTLSDLYWETAYMFYVIRSILGVVGIIAFSFFVVWYGCSGRMKNHTDWIFKGKKKTDDVNSGAKYG